MFFTRPQLTPLGLDLIEVDGGGSCPTQFSGTTADQRPVFIHYRGGRLSVTCGAVGEDDVSADSETLLDATFGPYLHGSILLEQVCDLAGITIRGQRPQLSEDARLAAADKSLILDCSGRTTYWERQVQTTAQGARRFLDELERRFPGTQLLDVEWHTQEPVLPAHTLVAGLKRRFSINRLLDVEPAVRRSMRRYSIAHSLDQSVWYTLGFGGSAESVETLLAKDHAGERDLAEAFAHTAEIQPGLYFLARRLNSELAARQEPVEFFRRALDEQYSTMLERPVVFAPSTGGRVRSHFRTGDNEGRRFIESFIEAFDACFAQSVDIVDLATGEVQDRHEAWRWYSRDLVKWCRSEPNRYISGFQSDHEAKRLMAYRPSANEVGYAESMPSRSSATDELA